MTESTRCQIGVAPPTVTSSHSTFAAAGGLAVASGRAFTGTPTWLCKLMAPQLKRCASSPIATGEGPSAGVVGRAFVRACSHCSCQIMNISKVQSGRL